MSDHSPTELVAARLRLPAAWIAGIERRRRPARTASAARRAWVLEQLCVALAGICLFPCVYYVITGDAMRAGYWLAGSVYHLICYVMNLRGHGWAFMLVALPSLPLGMLAYPTTSGISYAPACLIMAMLLCLCSISESTAITAAYGAFLVVVSVLLGIAVGAPQADTLNVGTVMTVAAGIATVGSRVWILTHRQTAVAMAANGELAAQLKQANQELETVNDDLLSSNLRLLDANARLERRVMERTRELSELSSRDELTGLHNRRHFMGRLEKAAANPAGLSLLMLDVDFFKTINDTCGHSVGDLVLRHLADVMTNHVGSRATLARIGGEEFAVLLPGVDERSARSLAETLRQAVERVEWPAEVQPLPRRVTISVGLVAASGRHAHPAGLLRDADAALYASKRNGRNRVTSSSTVGVFDQV